MLKTAYTTREIALALGLTRQGVEWRANTEAWDSRPRPGRGGGVEWLTNASMPEQTRLALSIATEKALAPSGPVPVQTGQPLPAEIPGAPLTMLEGTRRAKALAKADLVSLYLGWLHKYGKSDAARRDFIRAYDGGAWPALKARLGKRSWKSIERWKVQQREYQSIAALADKRGLAHRGKSCLTERHRQVLLGKALTINNPALSYACNNARDAFLAEGLTVPSDTTMRRFLKGYMEGCYAEWTFFREGKKAWNDKAALYIERNWDLVQVGDILIADGHTLNFESFHPETGKPCRLTLLLWYDGASNYPLGWELMPSENVACISSALRRAIIRLGKMPKLAYLDNGKAFRAKFFKGCDDFRQAGVVPLYQELGMDVIHAWAYHGQSKTIERFFGTLHELENYVPSYTGRSIDTKPARMHRGETMHRKLYEAAGGRPLTLWETHQAIAWFFDKYVQRPQRGHLKGRTPFEIFSAGVGPGVDVARLNELMLTQDVREIDRGGTVRILGNRYYAPELYGKKHAAAVRYDTLNPASVLVYSTDGRFLAEATRMDAVHPAAYYLGDDDQQKKLSDMLEIRKGQEKLAGASARALYEGLIKPETQDRMAALASAPPAALEPARPKALPAADADEIARLEAVRAAHKAAKAARPAYTVPGFFPSQADKYAYLFDLSVVRGVALNADDVTFCNDYEHSEEYQEITGARYEKLRRLYERQAHKERVA